MAGFEPRPHCLGARHGSLNISTSILSWLLVLQTALSKHECKIISENVNSTLKCENYNSNYKFNWSLVEVWMFFLDKIEKYHFKKSTTNQLIYLLFFDHLLYAL